MDTASGVETETSDNFNRTIGYIEDIVVSPAFQVGFEWERFEENQSMDVEIDITWLPSSGNPIKLSCIMNTTQISMIMTQICMISTEIIFAVGNFIFFLWIFSIPAVDDLLFIFLL